MHKRGQRGRPPRRRPALRGPSTLSIGNCRVELPNSLLVSVDAGGLCVNVPDVGPIIIKVANETPPPLTDYSVTLLNPKSLDGSGKLLLQEVLKLYAKELPAMKYAADTGKESQFLESCLFGGKYCTIILRNRKAELIGAITYQILSAEAQAEVPLAAIAQSHHRKGFGTYLYKELQKRLLDVGTISIFCWGDEESLAFWAKQGFVMVAEVDGRGRPWKLPIKADVRRAMSIPGSATLMISYLSSPSTTCANVQGHSPTTAKMNSEVTSSPLRSISPASPKDRSWVQGHSKSPHMTVTTPQAAGECKPNQDTSITPAVLDSSRMETISFNSIVPLNMESILSDVAPKSPKDLASKSHSPTASLSTANDRPAALADITNTTVSIADGPIRPFKKRRIVQDPQANSYEIHGDFGKTPSLDKSKGNATTTKTTSGSDNGELSRPAIELSGQNRNVRARLRSGLQSLPPEVNGTVDSKENERTQETRAAPLATKEVAASAPLETQTVGRRKRLRLPVVPVPTKVCSRRSSQRQKAGVVLSKESIDGTSSPQGQTENETGLESENKMHDNGQQLPVNIQLSNQGNGGKRHNNEAVCKSSAEHHDRDLQNQVTNGTQLESSPVRSCIDAEEQKNGGVNPDALTEQPAAAPEGVQVKNYNHSSTGKEAPAFHVQTTKNAAATSAKSLSKAKPVIMFMNMADENQKKQLTKHVERLEGQVTSDGRQCTHVVTGEVRRTLNFCVAISQGAWILSPDWLKFSVKQKSFADESRFVLRDKKFEVKYKLSLQEVIFRARHRPNPLFDGMSIYVTPHVLPPSSTISQIVEAAGGQILQNLEEATVAENKSNVAVVACEEDISEAMCAAKADLHTFSSDWLLTCVVKQELDLSATQFLESL